MRRASLSCFALGCLLGPLLFGARQIPSPPSPEQTEDEEKGLSPRDRYRRKIEREIEGVWKVEELSHPAFPHLLEPQGYFLFYREHVAFTVTANLPAAFLTGVGQAMFQSGFKKYTVTDDARFLLQTLIAVQRVGGEEIERPLSGEIEERQLTFELDTVRISRSADDYIVLRKIATGPPAARKPFPRPRALPRPGLPDLDGTGAGAATRPARRDD
jgi:hypothetical protein